MNKQRMIILGVAAVAAIVAAFLVRALLGGGTEKSKAAPEPRIAMASVLVASDNLQSGQALSPAMVHWQQWPKSAVADTFITQASDPNAQSAVAGTIARAPIVTGEPITTGKIVHSDSAGFMAATLSPGMRAVSIGISTETGAGGFILPNDRVDVIVTNEVSSSPRRYLARTILNYVRVLAVDQTYTKDQDKDQTVLAKTATLELTPAQAETVERARADGTLSLALRPLGDNGANAAMAGNMRQSSGEVQIIRYGIAGSGGSVQ